MSQHRHGSGRQASPRSAARLAAVQALYQAEMTGITGRLVTSEFVKHRLGRESDDGASGKADETLFRELAEGALSHGEELDALIVDALTPDWPLERLEMVLRAILRAAAFELSHRIEVPARVVITEYVNVAHAFFAGKEPGLVNGVLDRLARQLRPTEFA